MAGPPLLEVFATLPDPRRRRGRMHPLPAALGLAVVAILAGSKSSEAIAQFGRDHGKGLAHALGFRRKKTPTKSTFSKIFRAPDLDAFEAALRRWLQDRCDRDPAIAPDGKTLRGSRNGDIPGIHLPAAFATDRAAVLGQLRVAAGTNEHEAALRLLGALPLAGEVVSGDAMFTHRDFAQAVRDGGGDYLLFVKDNQPELQARIEAALHDGAEFSPLPTQARGSGRAGSPHGEQGHGRREYRRLTSTTALNGYADWPDVGQVFVLERVRVVGDKTGVEVAHGITGVGRGRADAERLLALSRGHWGTENGLPYVRDVTPGEDSCRVRTGAAPQVLAALRNVVVHLLGRVKAPSKAAATRHFAARPFDALSLLLI